MPADASLAVVISVGDSVSEGPKMNTTTRQNEHPQHAILPQEVHFSYISCTSHGVYNHHPTHRAASSIRANFRPEETRCRPCRTSHDANRRRAFKAPPALKLLQALSIREEREETFHIRLGALHLRIRSKHRQNSAAEEPALALRRFVEEGGC